MNKQLLALAAAAAVALPAQALTAGDLAFTAFNADEDGFALVTFVDLAAGSKLYFADNEWSGTAFNTGESYLSWASGAGTIAAGTVIRFTQTDKVTLGASVGTLSREAVSGSANYGIANSNEVLYVYTGSSATSPTAFVAAITNGSFTADGSIANTGLVEGLSAIRLNTNAPGATPDYAEYTGPRTGQPSFAGYKALVGDVSNWTVDTSNGSYAATVPVTTAFTVTAVPEPGTWALLLAGAAAVGAAARRRA